MNARFLPAVPLGALLIGSIGPWATASLAGITATKNGLDGDGAITLVLALVAGALLAAHALGRLGRAAPIAVIVLAAIALVVCIVDLIDTSGSKLGIDTAPGWGLWLAAAGSAGLLALAVVLLRRAPRASELTARS